MSLRKCAVCGEIAIARLPNSKLFLCADHFKEYVERRVLRTIERYRMIERGNRILVAVSGGKDSATMLAILKRLRDALAVEITALHINLGIPNYSDKSEETTRRLTQKLAVPLVVVKVEDLIGMSVPQLARKAGRPVCSACGLVKRYLLNAAALEGGFDKVALGHTLNDMSAYILKTFLTQDLSSTEKLGPYTETTEGVAVSRIRPLYETSELETLLYANFSGLPFVGEKCPHASPSTLEAELKRFMAALNERYRGIEISLVRRIAKSGKATQVESAAKLCKSCGLISNADLCSYCKITATCTGEPKGSFTRRFLRDLLRLEV